ncbi:MAG: Rieske (2Fe-2S) protein [Candidatus Thorarchaeota archaeon]
MTLESQKQLVEPMEVRVCTVDDLSDGKVISVLVDDAKSKIMVRKIENQIYATSAFCTHKAVDLTKQGIFQDEYVTCKNHLATFDMTTGEVIQPPATNPLPVYPVIVRNNEVFLKVE